MNSSQQALSDQTWRSNINLTLHFNINPNLLLCFILSLLSIISIWLVNEKTLTTIFHDDSYFYMKIAYNYSQGCGATFDGVHMTDGFHPIYMLWLSFISKFFPIQGETGMRIVATADVLLFLAGLFIIDTALRKQNLSWRKRILLSTVLFFSFGLKDMGMESRLMFVVLCYARCVKHEEPSDICMNGDESEFDWVHGRTKCS